MFSSDIFSSDFFSFHNRSRHLTCGFNVNTTSPSWHKSMRKILRRIRGGEIAIDMHEGTAYVSGHGDPNKVLRLMGSRKGRGAEMAFLKTGRHYNHQYHYHHHEHPHYHHYNSYYGYSHPPLPYYRQSQAMLLPYHSYPGYGNYAYY